MNFRAIRIAGLGCFASLVALQTAPLAHAGKVSGVVVDPVGTPQMGVTVMISSEQLLAAKTIRLVTNDRGRFASSDLPDGIYSIQASLAGFLPAMEQHVTVSSHDVTRLEIMLGSVLSSFEKLRRQPDQPVGSDDWTWVVRSAAADRAVLRWQDDASVATLARSESAKAHPLRGFMELSSGADHPGSVADVADSPGTEFAYEFGVGENSELLMAGQYSYEDSSGAGGVVAEWLPTGDAGTGPVTTLLVRESRLGPDGPVFRGLRMSHDSQFAISDKVAIRYGAEYLVAGFNRVTSAVRPRGEIAVQVSPNWQISAAVVTEPWQSATISADALQSTLNTLDAFPTLLIRHDQPVLENGLHEELAAKRTLSKHADITAAVFHDRSSHTAVIGRGGPTGSDFLQDYFSQAFAYDGGETASMGARVAYRQDLTSDVKATIVYAYAGALAPASDADSASESLRESLATRYRQSVAGGVTAKVPRSGTKLTASYKWLSGTTVSRLDPYGESLYQMDPYLSLELRQPLPSIFPGHMQVQADVGNLLAQGYVPVATRDGMVVLVPSYRFVRGGLSLQF